MRDEMKKSRWIKGTFFLTLLDAILMLVLVTTTFAAFEGAQTDSRTYCSRTWKRKRVEKGKSPLRKGRERMRKENCSLIATGKKGNRRTGDERKNESDRSEYIPRKHFLPKEERFRRECWKYCKRISNDYMTCHEEKGKNRVREWEGDKKNRKSNQKLSFWTQLVIHSQLADENFSWNTDTSPSDYYLITSPFRRDLCAVIFTLILLGYGVEQRKKTKGLFVLVLPSW